MLLQAKLIKEDQLAQAAGRAAQTGWKDRRNAY